MTTQRSDALVSTAWLAGHLGDANIRIHDCAWHHASTSKDGRTQYRGRHLPGSVHFDMDQVADRTSHLPHMLPKPAEFAAKIGLMGVCNNNRVIVYDRHCGGSAAARAWWMFHVFGHTQVAILDGGYGKWLNESLPTDMSPVRPEAAAFSAGFDPWLVWTKADMNANLGTGAAQVIDARGPAKFHGSQEDVFPTRRLGHIPASINLPWADLIDPERGTVLEPAPLAKRFAALGVDFNRPIVTTCGSGITSCLVSLALHLLGQDSAVYDGSWAEWGLLDEAA